MIRRTTVRNQSAIKGIPFRRVKTSSASLVNESPIQKTNGIATKVKTRPGSHASSTT
jgi:hypothetical protein